jgi:hypothetical protein
MDDSGGAEDLSEKFWEAACMAFVLDPVVAFPVGPFSLLGTFVETGFGVVLPINVKIILAKVPSCHVQEWG